MSWGKNFGLYEKIDCFVCCCFCWRLRHPQQHRDQVGHAGTMGDQRGYPRGQELVCEPARLLREPQRKPLPRSGWRRFRLRVADRWPLRL